MRIVAEEAYEDRLCAFVDILGFKQLVGAIPHAISFQSVRDILRAAHSIPADHYTSNESIDFRSVSISDAIVLSTKGSLDGLIHIANAIENLALELLGQGYFTRGAIVKGKLCHDEKVIFGNALIHAYQLETEVVHVPRVMLTRDVVEIVPINSLFMEERVRRADDGPFFLHVLRKLQFTLWPDAQRREITGLLVDNTGISFGTIQSMLQKRFDEAVDNPRHFEKVKWFAQYWNRSRPDTLPRSFRISGPGLT